MSRDFSEPGDPRYLRYSVLVPDSRNRARSTSVSLGIALRAGIALAAVLAGACYARHILGMVYRPYDDEGYLLLAIDHYLKGGHLFTDVFSQYGPFYFYAQGALFGLLRSPGESRCRPSGHTGLLAIVRTVRRILRL